MDTSKPKVIQDIQGLFLYGSFEVEPGSGRPANVSTGGTSADCASVQMPFSIRQNIDH